jgi:hypothetical protein
MNPHDWFVEHRVAFVVRSLEAAEEKSFQQHLPVCAECREETTRLARELAWLPMGAVPAAPRPGFKRRLIEQALRGGRRRWQWVVPALAAAGILLALGLISQARQRAGRLLAENASLQSQLNATRDTLTIIRDANRVLQADIRMDGHDGGITIFADERSHRWNVVVHGLPAAGPSEVYQFWFICANGMVRGAQIHLDETKPAFLTLSMPEAGGAVMGAALTLEPMDQVSPEPKGKQLAHLML